MNRLAPLMAIHAEKQSTFVSRLRYWALLLLTVGLLQATAAQAQTINTLAGNGTTTYNGEDENGADDYATAVSLYSPRKAAIDASGNVYIADSSHNRIRRVDKNGIITTVAGNGTAGSSGDGGLATSASLNYPTGVAIDSKNNLYIADNQNHRIRKVTTDGKINTVAGTGAAGYNGDNIAATTAQLNTPVSVAIDSSGTTLYIVDKNNQRIRKVVDYIISTVAGNGTAGYEHDGETATLATLNLPFDVAVDASGNLFIADTTNQLIRKVTALDGLISTVAGNGAKSTDSKALNGDGGLATEASLNNPAGITVDANGNLYIADTTNQRIRQVRGNDGIINTVAGNGTKTFSGDGAAAISASLNNPYGITVDATGNLYIADTSNQRVRTVTPTTTATSTTLSSSPSSSTYGSTVQFAATVTGNNPLGSVTIMDGSSTACGPTALSSYTTSNEKTITCGTYVLTAGTHTITAVYSGDSSNASSTSAALTQTVSLATTTTTLTSSPSPSTYGEPVTFTASVSGSASYPPSGTVTFKEGSTTLCPNVAATSSKATCSYNTLSVGNHSITAVYSGDNYNVGSTSNTVTQTVNKVPTTTILTNSPSTSAYGDSVTFTASVSGNSSNHPAGTVDFMEGDTILCNDKALNSSSITTCYYSALSAGNHNITAVYNGEDDNYASSTSNTVLQTVGQKTTTTALTSSKSTSVYGETVTFTASVSGGASYAATGTVTFKEGSTTLCNAMSLSAQSTTCSYSTLSAGSHSITAVYSGDNNNASSTSVALVQTVNKIVTTTALASSKSTSVYGETVTFTASVSGSSSYPASGTVTFKEGSTTLCNAMSLNTTTTPTKATCSYSALSVGSHSITATYSGDNNNASNTSNTVVQTVNKKTTSTALISSASTVTYGSTVTFKATVTGTSPTGNVTFKDNGQTFNACTAVTVSNAQASCSYSSFAQGSHSITATYNGDNYNAASTSPKVSLTVNAPLAISLTSPVEGMEFPTSIQVNMVASVSGGSAPIKQVDFYVNGAKIGTDTTSTYSYITSKLANGSHTLKATVIDTNGSSKTSASVTITVCYECY